jgi:ribosomal protein L29
MADFSKQDVQELKKLVADKREALRAFRFGAQGTRTRNTREGRNLRKEIARMLTELRKREVSNTK